MGWWRERKRWQRWSMIVGAVVVVLAIIGAAVGGGDEKEPYKPYSDDEAQALIDAAHRSQSEGREATASAVPTTPAETPAERAAEREAARKEAARERAAARKAAAKAQAAAAARARARAAAKRREAARRERLLRGTLVEGYGSKVLTINADRDGPLVVETSHTGSSNFVIQLTGGGVDELMVNEIGSYRGTVVAADVPSGRHRLGVEADGSWSVRYRQPQPLGGEPSLLRTFTGDGSAVIAVQTIEDLEPVVTARNTGDSNFVVQLIGYGGDVSGSALLVNEIGPYSGQMLAGEVPSGDYLLAVQAVGNWSVKFTR
jgi:hypothetical protein